MSSTTAPAHALPLAATESARPSALRRVGVVAAGTVACAIPTMWTINITRMLLTGIEPDHRFHQITGQGVLVLVLWLAAMVPLLRAGWSGRRPSVAAGLQHLTVALAAIACSVAAPGGGSPFLASIAGLGVLLVWAALPVRPALRSLRAQLDPVLAPLAVLTAALYTPFVIDQIGLQNSAVGYHAQNPHFYDMAWLGVVLTGLAVLAAVFPTARRLALWTTAGSIVTGAAGLAFTTQTTWPALALALGAVGTVAVLGRQRVARVEKSV